MRSTTASSFTIARLFRLVAHPRRGVDVLAHRAFDVLHHLQHVGFRLRAERLVDERLAERFAEPGIGLGDAALPARQLLLLARRACG